jgi:hypothetical protein
MHKISDYLQDFLLAKHAISFFIRTYNFPDVSIGQLDNNETNEKLVIKIDEDEKVLIGRYPNGTNMKWIEEMAKYEEHYEYHNIILAFL